MTATVELNSTVVDRNCLSLSRCRLVASPNEVDVSILASWSVNPPHTFVVLVKSGKSDLQYNREFTRKVGPAFCSKKLGKFGANWIKILTQTDVKLSH